jgi:hypothetical protein
MIAIPGIDGGAPVCYDLLDEEVTASPLWRLPMASHPLYCAIQESAEKRGSAR